ncbi:MAG TPA: YdeI/OmpD-associated family protein [Nevskiaceae bacterium]|nr:YdeI/OmpD-associated family protein [Nevskiaceae bacterium]
MKKNPQVDRYIRDAAPYAQPILRHLRKLVHQACPQAEEKMKWSFPHFDYRGMMCSMAAFKQHCAFGFWKHKLLLAEGSALNRDAMGSFGRITGLDDLPPDAQLLELIRRAMALNDSGTKVEKPKAARKPPPQAPADLAAALKKNAKARTTYEAFSNTNRRDYVEWITEAKTEETRQRRLLQAIEWMAEGKPRNWKYQKC